MSAKKNMLMATARPPNVKRITPNVLKAGTNKQTKKKEIESFKFDCCVYAFRPLLNYNP